MLNFFLNRCLVFFCIYLLWSLLIKCLYKVCFLLGNMVLFFFIIVWYNLIRIYEYFWIVLFFFCWCLKNFCWSVMMFFGFLNVDCRYFNIVLGLWWILVWNFIFFFVWFFRWLYIKLIFCVLVFLWVEKVIFKLFI